MTPDVEKSFHSVLHLHDFKNRNIKEIKSLDSEVISEVLSHGCRKTRDMIELASGKSGKEISELLQIREADAQKLCALCHLMRLPGVKDTRASLYYDSGLRSLDDFRNSTPDHILKIIKDYIAQTGCGKSVPQRKEITTQIAVSRILPQQGAGGKA